MQPDTTLPLPKEVKVWKGILNAGLASPPTIIEQQNTTGVTWTATRTSTGQYTLECSEELTLTYDTVHIQAYQAQDGQTVNVFQDGAQEIGISSHQNISPYTAIDQLTDLFITIEIHNITN